MYVGMECQPTGINYFILESGQKVQVKKKFSFRSWADNRLLQNILQVLLMIYKGRNMDDNGPILNQS